MRTWSLTYTEFDKLLRLVQRQTNVAERVPGFYIRTLSALEGSVNAALAKEKEAKKKMNASNARALTTMRQRIKKTNKEYERDLKLYQEVSLCSVTEHTLLKVLVQDPEAFEREYAVAAEPEVIAPKTKKSKQAALDDDDETVPENEDFTTVGKGGRAMQFTAEGIYKNLQLVQEARGKKVGLGTIMGMMLVD